MNLVEITAAGHGVLFDLAYAGADNFTGRPVYRRAACYLHADAEPLLAGAVRLAAVQAGLVFCPPAEHREPMSGLAIPFSMWQCAGHGDAAGPGFVR